MSETTSLASASAAATSSSAALSMPPQFKVVGIVLAVVSGLLIGCSFVFKKKGLIQSQAGHEAGEGVAYLKSALWWTGMSMMIVGEICNFAAYAFVEALVVTPLGALSVVVSAILSSFFLNEKLTFFGWVGCFLCIVGSVIIALNGPEEQSVSTIRDFEKLFISVGFLIYGGVVIAASIIIIFFVAPKYGKKTMLWYILICSLIGGLSVSCTQGLGASIVTSIRGKNQFTYWFTYFLLVFVIITLLTEIYYLNMALALFNTAMVTPTYYVIFTFCTLVTSVILYQGLKASATQIITIVMGFLVICAGITILQMSKVDPETLNTLDRKSTMLLAANRSTQDAEKGDLAAMEEPGVDAIRGSFGAIGSIIRARSMASTNGTIRSRRAAHGHSRDDSSGSGFGGLKTGPSLKGLQRHQLFDNPVPPMPEDAAERISMYSNAMPGTPRSPKKSTTIQFRQADVVGHEHAAPGATGEADESLALDDFIQRTASPLNSQATGTRSPLSAPAGAVTRRMYEDPYVPHTTGGGYDRFQLRQDSISSFADGGPGSPEGPESPPRVDSAASTLRGTGGNAGRYQRSYPHDREMDREESMSLVDGRDGRDRRDDREGEYGLRGGVANGGIRLVPSLPRR